VLSILNTYCSDHGFQHQQWQVAPDGSGGGGGLRIAISVCVYVDM
jgi:hypothetical protein